MTAAISVLGLSKRFRLGLSSGSGYHTLRDAVMSGVWRATRLTARLISRSRQAGSPPQDYLWALRDVTFDIRPGEVVGVVGRNGAGKSTLLKLLSRITCPSAGEIRLRGRIGSLLEVGTGFHPELTGRENIFLNGSILGMTHREVARKFDEIVNFAEVDRFLDTPVKRYSSGMYTRLAFAVAAHLEPEVLIVDEVLAVGDSAFQQKCLGKMGQISREGRTVLFVSHTMSAVKSLCTRALLIESGKLVMDGEVDRVVNRYLTAGCDMARTGVIPENAPRLCDVPGEASFRSVRLTDDRNRETSTLYYGQSFRVHFMCNVGEEIPDGHFEVSIGTTDGCQITYSTTLDGGKQPTVLKPGRHEVAVTIHAHLLPGDYTIDLGVHHHDGRTCDYVQRTLDFTVLRVAETGDDHYFWPITRGLVRPRAEWHPS